MVGSGRADRRARGMAALCAMLLIAGCRGTAPTAEFDGWREQAELEVGGSAVFDEGAIRVVLTEAGDSHALVTVELGGSSRTGRLTTDPGGFVTFPPYRIRLVSARTDQRATLEVTRPGS